MLKHFPFCTFSWHHSSYEHGMSVDYQHQYLFLSISNLVTGEKKTGALTKRLQAQPVNSNLLKTFFFFYRGSSVSLTAQKSVKMFFGLFGSYLQASVWAHG